MGVYVIIDKAFSHPIIGIYSIFGGISNDKNRYLFNVLPELVTISIKRIIE